MSIDPKADELPSWGAYTYVNDNPVNRIDPEGDVAHLPITIGVGATVGAGVGIYNLSKEYGGFVNAMKELANGNGRAGGRLGASTATGAALGTGFGGAFGAVAIGASGNFTDQLFKNGGDISKTNVLEVGVSGATAGIGHGLGNAIVTRALMPRQVSTFGTPFADHYIIPGNDFVVKTFTIFTTEAGLNTGAALAGNSILPAQEKPEPQVDDSCEPSNCVDDAVPTDPIKNVSPLNSTPSMSPY